MDSSLSHRGGGGGRAGLNAFYWYQILTLNSAVVEVQDLFSSHGAAVNISNKHFAIRQRNNKYETYQTRF